MQNYLPKNWPSTLQYTNACYSNEIHPVVMQVLLSSDMTCSEFDVSILRNNKIHPHIEIQIIEDKKHFLMNKPTPLGHRQRGIFATKPIKANVLLGEYVGEIVFFDLTNHAKIFQPSYYLWLGLNGKNMIAIDGQYKTNELSLVNDYHNIANTNNVRQSSISYEGIYKCVYHTTQPIRAGEELLVDYRCTEYNKTVL